MNSTEFRDFGKAVVDYVAEYHETIRDRNVISDVKPKYLIDHLPKEIPEKGEQWQDILKDVDTFITKGLTHYLSPNMHAYYPVANSFPSIVGELLDSGYGCTGVNWEASPALTELECIVMDWIAKMIHLPQEFLNSHEGPGGGIVQSSGSESIFLAVVAGREKKVKQLLKSDTELKEWEIRGKLVAYTSDQANSSVEKAGLLTTVPVRLLATNEGGQLEPKTLLDAIAADRAQGLIPSVVVATLGTTEICAFDDLEQLASICKDEQVWLHVDAAYAGAAFTCPEYRDLMKGIEHADSFEFNPHKWLLMNWECSCLWTKNVNDFIEPFTIKSVFLNDEHESQAPEFRHWGTSICRSFRALKMWFVLRSYGQTKIQKYIRDQIALGKYFGKLVEADDRFELCRVSFGVVIFKVKGDEALNRRIMDNILRSRLLYFKGATFHGAFVLRIVICSGLTEERDLDYAMDLFKKEVAALTEA